MTSSQSYHIPVLLHDAVDGLKINPKGIYVDATFGGGGHSQEILGKIDSGRLIGFDQDPDARKNIPATDKFTFVPQNFRYLKNCLRLEGVIPVDGVLADLGVSSWQFDQEDRGFSFRFDGPLDMRMSQAGSLTAAKIVNEYDVELLAKLFREYGEIKEAYSLAKRIEEMRLEKNFELIADLNDLLEKMNHNGKKAQFKAKVFQALRIEVNEEIQVIKEMLEATVDVLKPGGRLVVISYHSLEDRLVKNFIKKGKFVGDLEKDFYGNPIKPFKEITRKPMLPSQEEITANPRARSAKLRIAEKA
ncbi:MAG: 16S rRNA (cytosine(1402)-N(4))-methyltransferase RsmH [Crocinitomicaceae bacterium]|jgi:16S rRNA (cytosine1402-N4)-methyltransferase|nr:16S rRNA (cytosine(1402)-N(4))-methyltransferase RsmH [Crocinitomicaceae bacterium]MBT6029155.1 16S rRNA (cytosine(1402)-N(4))-methyltransferase RsmH [Crocinitomicaceae bacterium]MBT6515240.1 16S rRNA (cytosine(1402)-N(4))-methyltransferase RsmH [Crocinitomicaceae bacterium]MDG2330247.1 16S rRNA (cytosine(1402)-N(4))-methyltransferase RsmH [Flavobacteriales bacterium]